MTRFHSATLAETGFASPDTAGRHPAPVSMRRLANLVTAGAVALSLLLASALPVRAGGRDDLAKALIAAIVIGALLNSTSKGNAAPPPAPQPQPQPVQRPRLPAVCAIDLNNQGRVFSENCLSREGFSYRLPAHCASEARIYGRPDRIYGAACLRSAGFRVSGR
ncbi:MAG: hypothetical protein V4712_09410 [Pseudomonadota bacterium]